MSTSSYWPVADCPGLVGAIGLDTNAGVETYNGVGKITTKT